MRTRRRRIRERGAALVEAAFVLPVLAIFLGLIMYQYNSFREKMRAQATTRANAFALASHGCEGASGPGTMWSSIQSSNGAAQASYTYQPDGVASAKQSPFPPTVGQAVSTIDNVHTFKQARSTASGEASGGHLQRQVSGKSVVFCNEKPADGLPIPAVTKALNDYGPEYKKEGGP